MARPRHSQAGRARMDWAGNRHLRVFIHVLRTNFNYDHRMNARIFTRAHPREIAAAGYVDGMPPDALRDQYDQRENTHRPVALWRDITAVNQTPAEMASRQTMIIKIQTIAAQIAREDAGEGEEDGEEDDDEEVEHESEEDDVEEDEDQDADHESEEDGVEDEGEEMEPDAPAGEDDLLAPDAQEEEYYEDEDGQPVLRYGSGPPLGLDIHGRPNEDYVREELLNDAAASTALAGNQNARITNNQLINHLQGDETQFGQHRINLALLPEEDLAEAELFPSQLALSSAASRARALQSRAAARQTQLPSRLVEDLPHQGLDPDDADKGIGTDGSPIFSKEIADEHPDKIWYWRGRGWVPGLPPNQDGKNKTKQAVRIPRDIILTDAWQDLKRLNDQTGPYYNLTAAELDILLLDRNNVRRSSRLRDHGRVPRRVRGRRVRGVGVRYIDGIESDDDSRADKRNRDRGRQYQAIAPDNRTAEAEIEDEMPDIQPGEIIPPPLYGANRFSNQPQQALSRTVDDRYQLGTALTNAYNRPPSTAGYRPTATNTLDLPAPAADTNPYLRLHLPGIYPFQPSSVQQSVCHRPQSNATINQTTASQQQFSINAHPTPSALPNTNLPPQALAGYPPPMGSPYTYPPLLQGIANINHASIAMPQQPASTVPHFLQPRVPIQPLQMREFRVDRAYAEQHPEANWLRVVDEFGDERYQIVEDAAMWHVWDEWRRGQR